MSDGIARVPWKEETFRRTIRQNPAWSQIRKQRSTDARRKRKNVTNNPPFFDLTHNFNPIRNAISKILNYLI